MGSRKRHVRARRSVLCLIFVVHSFVQQASSRRVKGVAKSFILTFQQRKTSLICLDFDIVWFICLFVDSVASFDDVNINCMFFCVRCSFEKPFSKPSFEFIPTVLEVGDKRVIRHFFNNIRTTSHNHSNSTNYVLNSQPSRTNCLPT